jgi:hypothetical protein
MAAVAAKSGAPAAEAKAPPPQLKPAPVERGIGTRVVLGLAAAQSCNVSLLSLAWRRPQRSDISACTPSRQAPTASTSSTRSDLRAPCITRCTSCSATSSSLPCRAPWPVRGGALRASWPSAHAPPPLQWCRRWTTRTRKPSCEATMTASPAWLSRRRCVRLPAALRAPCSQQQAAARAQGALAATGQTGEHADVIVWDIKQNKILFRYAPDLLSPRLPALARPVHARRAASSLAAANALRTCAGSWTTCTASRPSPSRGTSASWCPSGTMSTARCSCGTSRRKPPACCLRRRAPGLPRRPRSGMVVGQTAIPPMTSIAFGGRTKGAGLRKAAGRVWRSVGPCAQTSRVVPPRSTCSCRR